MKAELEKQLLEAAKGRSLPDGLINEIFEEYSQKLALAINPIDYPSAPFIIAALNAYSVAIAKQFPGVDSAARDLMSKTASACFKMPVKGGGTR